MNKKRQEAKEHDQAGELGEQQVQGVEVRVGAAGAVEVAGVGARVTTCRRTQFNLGGMNPASSERLEKTGFRIFFINIFTRLMAYTRRASSQRCLIAYICQRNSEIGYITF